jgi:DNA polymerase-3 subunit epsilon
MEFVALDVETANADSSSICQIGIARFENGRLVEEWSTLVNPEDYFDFFNVSIHGIDEDTVRGAPTFPAVVAEIRCRCTKRIVVSHTPFDRAALAQAYAKYDLERFECTWLDSARVARRAWPEYSQRGYGLDNVCEAIGYRFTHHDALEDAKAAGHVILAAISETGLDLVGWLKRVQQPVLGSIAVAENTEGPLHGEVLVFTGALGMTRAEAAGLAARAGCTVTEGVTKRTTILVVGNQDAAKLAGHDKSSKHRKAEDLIRKGSPIKILTERDFEMLVGLSCIQDDVRPVSAEIESELIPPPKTAAAYGVKMKERENNAPLPAVATGPRAIENEAAVPRRQRGLGGCGTTIAAALAVGLLAFIAYIH